MLHPFLHTSPHVFNRAGSSMPALCCIQYKSFVYNRLTADWRGITSGGNMPARDPLRRFERDSRISSPSRLSPLAHRGPIVSVTPIKGRSC
jgi:hypothetical protein